MQPFISPDDIRRDHELMIRRELQRNYPEHHLYFRESDLAIGAMQALRRQIGRWLISAGMRIEPAARRRRGDTVNETVPMAARTS